MRMSFKNKQTTSAPKTNFDHDVEKYTQKKRERRPSACRKGDVSSNDTRVHSEFHIDKMLKNIEKIRDKLIADERKRKRVYPQGLFDSKHEIKLDQETSAEVKSFVEAMKNIQVNLNVDDPIKETLGQAAHAIPEIEQHMKAGIEESVTFVTETITALVAAFCIGVAARKLFDGGSKWWLAVGIYSSMVLGTVAGKHGYLGAQVREAFMEYERQQREQAKDNPGYRPAPDYTRSAKFKPQFGSSDISPFIKPVLMFLSVYTTGKMPLDKKVDTFINRSAKIPAAKEGVESMVTWGVDLVRSMINFIRSDVLGYSVISWADEAAPDVTDWCAQVVEFTRAVHLGELPVDIENCDRLNALIMRGTHFSIKYFNAREHGRIRDVVNQHIVWLRKYQAKFERANLRGESIRKEALGVWLRGPSGAGKTMVTIPLALSLTKRLMTPERFAQLSQNTKELFYQRHVEDEYWDGYFGQFVVIFDETGQIRDSVGCQTTSREWMDLLRFFGVATNVLHMADLPNKGVVECRSEIGIVTTNMPDFSHIRSIIQPEAVERRFHVIADVVPRTEFCRPGTEGKALWDRRLDRSNEWLTERGCAKEVYEFWIWDYTKQCHTQKMNYDEFVDHCVKIKRAMDVQHEKYAKVINEIIDGDDRSAEEYFDTYQHSVPVSQAGPKGKGVRELTETEKEILASIDEALKVDPRSEVVSDLDKQYLSLHDMLNTVRSHYDELPTPKLFDFSTWTISEYLEYDSLVASVREELGERLFKELTQDPNGIEKLGVFFRVTGSMHRVITRARKKMFRTEEPFVEKAEEVQTGVKNYFSSLYSQARSLVSKYPILKTLMIVLAAFGAATALYRVFRGTDVAEKVVNTISDTVKRIKCYIQGKMYSGEVVFLQRGGALQRCIPEDGSWTMLVEPGDHVQIDATKVEITEKCSLKFEPDEDPTCLVKLNGEQFEAKSITVMRKGAFMRFLVPSQGLDMCVDLEDDDAIYINGVPKDVKGRVHVVASQIDSGVKGRGQQNKHDKHFERHSMRHPEKVVLQGCFDPNAKELVLSAAKNNQYTINLPRKDRKIGILTFVAGQVAMFPYHFVRYFENEIKMTDITPETIVELKNVLSGRTFKVPVSMFLEAKVDEKFKSRDVCFAHFPTMIMHRNLTKSFCPNQFWNTPHDKGMLLAVLDQTMPVLYETTYEYFPEFIVQEDEHDDTTQFKVVSCAVAYASTTGGDCGALGSVNSPAVGPGKLFYLHIAGNKDSNTAVGAILTREDIEYAIGLFGVKAGVATPQCLEKYPIELAAATFGACPVARLPRGKGVYSPNKTKIVPSPLHNVILESRVAPAKLGRFMKDGEMIDPMTIAIKKYFRPGEHVASPIYHQALHHLTATLFNSSTVPAEREIFSFEEAVKGRVGDPYFSCINRKSGAGWDMEFPNLKTRGKSAFFGNGEEFDLTGPECRKLKQLVERDIADAKQGIRHLHVYSDYLKDETRPLAKVHIGKTRLISGAPLRLVVATRMLFLAFSIWIMRNCVLNGIAVGINCYSDKWDLVARYLKSMSNHTVAGDFEGHDASMFYHLLMGSLHIINAWYDDGPELAMARYIYFMEVISSFHASGETLFQWISKLPSGHPLTTILNCIAVLLLGRIAFIIVFGSVNSFNDLVKMLVYGDDNLFSIHHTICHVFNQHTIAKALATVGFVYTSEDKLTDVAPTRHLTEVTFLKRAFRFEDRLHRYVAPLELSTVLEIPMWSKKGAAYHTIAVDNVNNCLHELSLHDQATFDLWAPKVIRASQTHLGYYPVVIDRLSLLREVCDRVEYW